MSKILVLVFFIGLTGNSAFAQSKTSKQLNEEDSAKVANMPHAVKDNLLKLFPESKNVKWSVYDIIYMAEFNVIDPNAEHYLERDGNAVVQFYKGGTKDSKWEESSITYITPET